MDTSEILNAISHGLMGPVIGLGLAVTLWLWRRYREAGPYRLRDEAIRLVAAVVPIAVGALLRGADWRTVLAVSVSALLSGIGLNSKPLPPVDPKCDAPDALPSTAAPKDARP